MQILVLESTSFTENSKLVHFKCRIITEQPDLLKQFRFCWFCKMFECLILFSKDHIVGLFMEWSFKNQTTGFAIKNFFDWYIVFRNALLMTKF